MEKDNINDLIVWYMENKRDLPWRKTNDSYKIWISEVMLQQTRVEAVKTYYERFLSELPTIQALADVSEDKLLKLWEGLGYYSRARNLKKCAEELIRLGYHQLPDEETELKNLPGIGPYTAGAILSIAYQKKYPALDGNVLRILARVFEDDRDMLNLSVRKSYEDILKNLMIDGYTREFTEAFIELGALICLPNGKPLCENCPLKSICQSYKHNTMMDYPKKKQKKSRKVEEKTVFVIKVNDCYVIQKRDNSGLLAGMYGLIDVGKYLNEEEITNYFENTNLKDILFLGDFKHIFSHIEWHMKAYLIKVDSYDKGILVTKEKLFQEYSFPTAYLKILKKVY